jgi:hypothetical protein
MFICMKGIYNGQERKKKLGALSSCRVRSWLYYVHACNPITITLVNILGDFHVQLQVQYYIALLCK